MDGYLTELSDQVGVSADYTRHADGVMNKLFNTLQKESKFSIDRLRPEGGAEKRTSLRYSVDYDVTAFVNDVTSPFRLVLDDFQDVILKEFDVEEKDMKVTSHSVQFTLEGVDFDLLVATNMAKSHIPGSTQMKQFRAMVDAIAKSPDKIKASKDNSAGLTETAVEFVKMQSTFVHKVARLAKYWNSTIFYTKYLNGRSSIFELLGITAGKEEEGQNYEPSILRAFRIFLDKVVNISKQRVIFDKFYKMSEIPANVLAQTPLLMDPSNPYNNFMYGFKKEAQSLFSTYAVETLKRLEMVERQIRFNHGYPDFKILFLPQPKPVDVGPENGFKVPTEFLVTVAMRNKKLLPNRIVRKSNMDKFVLQYTEKMMASFIFVLDLEAKHKSTNKTAFVEQGVKDAIGDLYFRARPSWGGLGLSSHDDYDVTYDIPIGKDGGDSMKVSMK